MYFLFPFFSLQNGLFRQSLTKSSKKSTEKRQFRGTPSGRRPAFACRPVLRSKQNTKQKHFFLFFFRRFCWFQRWNHWKGFKMNKKGWKRLKKKVSTSFWVRAAPESWSKYTTKDVYNNKILKHHIICFRSRSVLKSASQQHHYRGCGLLNWPPSRLLS